jgi:hypothetical protein
VLRVSTVLRRHIGPNRYVVTLRFADDPRALPAYAILRVTLRHGHPYVIGPVSGITGHTFVGARWAVTQSRHFTVFHSPFIPSVLVRNVLRNLEYQREQFRRKFGVQLLPVTNFYLYPNVSEMRRLTLATCGATSDNVGCADPFARPPVIQSATWPTYHEPIHIYERALEPADTGKIKYVAPLFIGEGTAVALEDRQVDPRLSDYCSDLRYVSLDECALQALNATQPLALLRDKGFNAANAGYAYSLGGSFVKYLILTYGYHRFGHFYFKLASQPLDRVRDYDVAARAVYHRTIGRLITAWVAHVRAEDQ